MALLPLLLLRRLLRPAALRCLAHSPRAPLLAQAAEHSMQPLLRKLLVLRSHPVALQLLRSSNNSIRMV